MPDFDIASCNVIRAMIPHIDGVKRGEINDLDDECHPRAIGKSTHKPRKLRKPETKSSKPIERVYSDVVGSMKSQSMGKAKYFVTLFHESSGLSMVKIMY